MPNILTSASSPYARSNLFSSSASSSMARFHFFPFFTPLHSACRSEHFLLALSSFPSAVSSYFYSYAISYLWPVYKCTVLFSHFSISLFIAFCREIASPMAFPYPKTFLSSIHFCCFKASILSPNFTYVFLYSRSILFFSAAACSLRTTSSALVSTSKF